MRRDLAQLSAGAKGSGTAAQRTMLADIVNEARWLLEKRHESKRVSIVLSGLARQFQDARITSFLPILIFKKASEQLQKVNGASSTGSATTMPADVAKLDFLRFEFKYTLLDHLRTRIEKAISPFMTPDPFAAGQDNQSYIVRSLYYDDLALSSYHQKIDGALLRSKFRLRTYTHNPEESCAAYLEIKGRYDSLVFKHRTGFTSAGGSKAFADCASTTDEVLDTINDSPVAENFRFCVARKKLAPIMLIDYTRRPYFSKYDPEFRLTFDDRLNGLATSQLFPSQLQTRRQLLPGQTVMEVKFKNAIPLWFHRIIMTYGLKRVSISKVCKGIEAFRLTPLRE